MKSNVETYIDYFRQMAVKHKDLQHDPASETGDSVPGAKRFARWNADEIISGLRSKVAFPALLIELYENDLQSSSVYDIKQRPRGAFTILEHVRPDDFTDEERAFAVTEEMVYDVLKQIWQHHYNSEADRCQTPFKQFHFDKLTITPVGPLFDNEFGYRVEFDFELQQTFKINEAPEEGTFL